MKVVFLDFDGVLNSQEHLDAAKARRDDPPNEQEKAYLDKLTGDHSKEYYLSHFRYINTDMVRLLNQVLESPRVKVVLSTSWRITWDVPELQAMLDGHGFRGDIIGATPKRLDPKYCHRKHTRGLEIQSWLDLNPSVKTFVILDDSNVQHLRDRQVRTRFDTGLTLGHVGKARKLLWYAPRVLKGR